MSTNVQMAHQYTAGRNVGVVYGLLAVEEAIRDLIEAVKDPRQERDYLPGLGRDVG